jgi:hypothetical protein
MSNHKCSDYPHAWPCSAVNAARENEREARERAAIEADARAERDGYAEGRGR